MSPEIRTILALVGTRGAIIEFAREEEGLLICPRRHAVSGAEFYLLP
jgi:hypothetical protein